MILPDTNVLIAYLNQKEPSFTLIKRVIIENSLLLSVITVAEVLIKADKKTVTIMNQLIDHFGISEITKPIMEQAIIFRKETLQKTTRTHLFDCFIAATAYRRKATLVTYNKNDYSFQGLVTKSPDELQ